MLQTWQEKRLCKRRERFLETWRSYQATRSNPEADASPGQPWWLLRWECTDLALRMFDTQNLSVVRGSSMMWDIVGRFADELLKPNGGNGSLANQSLQECAIAWGSASQLVALLRGPAEAVDCIGAKLHAQLAGTVWRAPSAWARAELSSGADPVKELSALKQAIFLERLAHQALDPGTVDLAISDARHASQHGRDTDEERAKADALDHTRAVDRDLRGLVRTTAAPELGGQNDKAQLSVANANRFRFGQQWRFGLVEELRSLWLLQQDREGEAPPREYQQSLSRWENLATNYVKDEDRPWPPPSGPREQVERIQQSFAEVAQRSRMRDYLAVIEADGARFGEWLSRLGFAQRAIASEMLEMAIVRTLASITSHELASLDDLLHGRPQAPEGQPVQLLYCAGDEFLVVMPGHRGLQVAQDFHRAWTEAVKEVIEHFESLSLGIEIPPLSELHFAIGVVIAHHNVPIKHLRSAAVELEGNAKKTEHGAGIDVAVLKTHGVSPHGVIAAREKTHGSATTRPWSLASYNHVLRCTRALHRVRFPTRQLRRIARRALRGEAEVLRKLSRDAKDARDRLPGAIRRALFEEANGALWADCAELMDVVRWERRQESYRGGGEESPCDE